MNFSALKKMNDTSQSTNVFKLLCFIILFLPANLLSQDDLETPPGVNPTSDEAIKKQKFGLESLAPNRLPEEEPPPPIDESDYEEESFSSPVSPAPSGFVGIPQVEPAEPGDYKVKEDDFDLPEIDPLETERKAKAPSEIRLRSSGYLEGNDNKPYSLVQAKEDLYAGSKRLYRLNVSVGKPSFSALNDYNKFYGDTSFIPYFSVETYLWNWYLNLGIVVKIGYYSDTGRAVIKTKDGSFESDLNSPIDLTMLPLQIGLIGDISPFPAKWIRLSAWMSFEATYYEEVRYSKAEPGTSKTTSPSTLVALENLTAATDSPFVNGGWKKAVATGAAVNFRIDGFDTKSASSMSTLGLGAVYFSPFVEIVTATPKDKFDLSRTIMGASLSFESL